MVVLELMEIKFLYFIWWYAELQMVIVLCSSY